MAKTNDEVKEKLREELSRKLCHLKLGVDVADFILSPECLKLLAPLYEDKIINSIKQDIIYNEKKLSKYPKKPYYDCEIIRLKGIIYGLEQSIISVNRA